MSNLNPLGTGMRQYEPANYPAIPEPTTDPRAMLNTINALKEAVEMLTGQRGRGGIRPMSFNDAVRLGLIDEASIPNTVSRR